jgi:hypothetical protein
LAARNKNHTDLAQAAGGPAQRWIEMMRQSEFEKISARLDRAELALEELRRKFALEELRKKAVELEHRLASAKTPEEMADLNLEAIELLQQLQKISDAVHAGNPAPQLRLVPTDAE